LAAKLDELFSHPLPRGLYHTGRAHQRYAIEMSIDHLTPKGKVCKREVLSARYVRTILDAVVEFVAPVKYVWEWVTFCYGQNPAAMKSVDWKFAKDQSFRSFFLLSNSGWEHPYPAESASTDDPVWEQARIELDYASLPKAPAVNLLRLLSWDVLTFDMLTVQLGTLAELNRIGAATEVTTVSNTLAYFDFPQYSPSSFFRNGTLTATCVGYGVWKGKSCIVYEYQCGRSEFDVHADPAVANLKQQGSSFYAGKLWLDVESGDLAAGDMTETIIATLIRSDKKAVPVQKRRRVCVERLEETESSAERWDDRAVALQAESRGMDVKEAAQRALEFSPRLAQFVARNEKEFDDLSAALRTIARMGFQSLAGQSIKDWEQTADNLTCLLEQIVLDAASQASKAFQEQYPGLQNLLVKFVAYTRVALDESHRFYNDPKILHEVAEMMQQGRADLNALISALDDLNEALKAQSLQSGDGSQQGLLDQAPPNPADVPPLDQKARLRLTSKAWDKPGQEIMIEVNELSKNFGKLKAVDSVSFSVKRGEIFGFLGPNGAGKTTTVRMLIGLAHPSAGNARIGGYDCVSQREAVHRITGVVFEVPTLYTRLSVRENLLLFTRLYDLPKTRLEQLIDQLELREVQHKQAEQLSKGWKQRVLIARALLHEPGVLFLDEPTSGLDPNSAKLIRDRIRELRHSGVTIFLCTHDMHEADELCDRIGFIYKGRLVALDTPQALKSHGQPRDLQVEFVEDGQVIARRYPIDDPEAAELIYRKLLAKEVLTIATKQTTLADVFAQLTGGELS